MPLHTKKLNTEAIMLFLNNSQKTKCICYKTITNNILQKEKNIETILIKNQINYLKFNDHDKVTFWFDQVCREIKLHSVFQLSKKDFQQFNRHNINQALTQTSLENNKLLADIEVLNVFQQLRTLTEKSYSIERNISYEP